MLERVDNFPKTTELSLFNCYPSYMLGTCGVRSLDVKSTEVNTKKILKTRHFRELGVRFSSTLLNDKRTLLCYENKG